MDVADIQMGKPSPAHDRTVQLEAEGRDQGQEKVRLLYLHQEEQTQCSFSVFTVDLHDDPWPAVTMCIALLCYVECILLAAAN